MICDICGKSYGGTSVMLATCTDCQAIMIANLMEDEDSEIDDALDSEEEEGPEDEDLVTKDYVTFYRYNMGGRIAFVVDNDENWTDQARQYMENENYWPNVWLEEERGGFRNITLEGP